MAIHIRKRLRNVMRAALRDPDAPPKNVRGYSLRDGDGKITYVGITNNLRARLAEHQRDGKAYSHYVIETDYLLREEAAEWETKFLRDYRGFTGENPKLNRTPNGK